jgi:hypothetical protein
MTDDVPRCGELARTFELVFERSEIMSARDKSQVRAIFVHIETIDEAVQREDDIVLLRSFGVQARIQVLVSPQLIYPFNPLLSNLTRLGAHLEDAFAPTALVLARTESIIADRENDCSLSDLFILQKVAYTRELEIILFLNHGNFLAGTCPVIGNPKTVPVRTITTKEATFLQVIAVAIRKADGSRDHTYKVWRGMSTEVTTHALETHL